MDRKNILIVVLSFSGHLNPALNIGEALLGRGHEVTLMANKFEC